ncbi:hypothetical protein OPV22_027678 [Ensete ventricosum]|uniref:GIR1-like zinc ribbon domain-containing protein n=1 Tax=Ensete ventricosum TaxID=4639 RepID=A0AAV8Q6G2_ENSVE|nr:hypothetical protein OPV22_027678 [Ensete ventricosum]RWW32978.1 hypothetical protein GW17_00002316 [Ensete ventricosum]RZS24603.1 hypothetical protein BHM03_00057695 [Ensete ventricosum]
MEVEVSLREGKRGPVTTLDLLGGGVGVGPKDLDLSLKPSFGCHGDLHPLDLNLLPDDVSGRKKKKKRAAAPLCPRSQSVCTIEQVKWALERAQRESRGRTTAAQRPGEAAPGSPGYSSPSSSSSSSVTTASTKRRADGHEGGEEGSEDGEDSGRGGASLVAAGCPSCLSYVLISKANPRCPRCESQVLLPTAPPKKKPRIDLNLALTPPISLPRV